MRATEGSGDLTLSPSKDEVRLLRPRGVFPALRCHPGAGRDPFLNLLNEFGALHGLSVDSGFRRDDAVVGASVVGYFRL
jgi:hypothetical protein